MVDLMFYAKSFDVLAFCEKEGRRVVITNWACKETCSCKLQGRFCSQYLPGKYLGRKDIRDDFFLMWRRVEVFLYAFLLSRETVRRTVAMLG